MEWGYITGGVTKGGIGGYTRGWENIRCSRRVQGRDESPYEGEEIKGVWEKRRYRWKIQEMTLLMRMCAVSKSKLCTLESMRNYTKTKHFFRTGVSFNYCVDERLHRYDEGLNGSCQGWNKGLLLLRGSGRVADSRLCGWKGCKRRVQEYNHCVRWKRWVLSLRKKVRVASCKHCI